MTNEELQRNILEFAIDQFTFEERRSMGVEEFHQYVKEHFIPIPKSELVVGQEYNGKCRNSGRAIWDGKEFYYKRTKFGVTFDEGINHYEDDNEYGYDVFVPIKEI